MTSSGKVMMTSSGQEEVKLDICGHVGKHIILLGQLKTGAFEHFKKKISKISNFKPKILVHKKCLF